jgi:predicted SnoaL-like aldol condensation-catalyzing enzyme
MTIEENKTVARRWNEEGFNGHRIELIDECFHPNYTQRSGTEGPWSITIQGRDAAKAGFEQGFREYPNWRVTIEDMFAEGDKVAIRATLYNEGKPAANGNIIYRLAEGKILDDWFCWNFFGT